MRQPGDSPYVFVNTATGDRWDYIARAFKSALTHAKIGDFRFHDLRHTAASWMVMSGVECFPWPIFSATKTRASRTATATYSLTLRLRA
jgi:integrase